MSGLPKTRDTILVCGPGELTDALVSMKKVDSTLAVIAVHDTHLSSKAELKSFIAIRHTYYVYHVSSWLDETNYVTLFQQAVRHYLSLKGVVIRSVDADINIVRVQVLFGDNLIQRTMAEMFCQKMVEIRDQSTTS